ncbi:MAG: AAA family ATPase [Treponemataceae bacterium]|nr:MAG: AAA family ATPase [Treponemataceae bacterium]
MEKQIEQAEKSSEKPLRIAVSGRSGCGNTTVSSLLAQKLGITLVNYTFRQLAQESGMTLSEIMLAARTDDSFDKRVDERQVALAREGSCVLGSRLAIWMLPEANLKVYLEASAEVRAQRIFAREGGSIEDIKSFTALRDSEDTMRYKKLYNIDNTDYAFADMVIDTAKYSAEEIATMIFSSLPQHSRLS